MPRGVPFSVSGVWVWGGLKFRDPSKNNVGECCLQRTTFIFVDSQSIGVLGRVDTGLGSILTLLQR